MKKEKLYIVFDQIPTKKSGGLVATYISLSNLLKDTYEVEIISAFDCDEDTKSQFKNNKIHVVNKQNIDIRFYRIKKYIKTMNIKAFRHAISSCFLYFIKIPHTKKVIKKIINGNKRVIVSCPSAGIFMPKKSKFILEMHVDYKYFYGNNFIGRMQSFLMTKPTLALFRTKNHADNAPVKYKTDYIYNFFDNKGITRNNKIIKNKIIYVGRLEKQKNPIRLIKLAYELRKINKNFILDIYGSGSMLNDVKNEIKKLNLESVVFYKGFTTNKNVYKDYSLLWLSSDFEGFGLVIIEAKANGIPTISTNWGKAVYEVIDDNSDGFVVNTNEEFVEKTNQILNDENMQKRLSDNAYKNFDKFSKEKAKEKWINFLENYE